MLAIRLRRQGSKKRPFYRVVVTDSRAARDGRFVEILGFYNPRTSPETMSVDRERLSHWMGSGAQLSDTVRTLVARMPEAPAAGQDTTATATQPAAARQPVTARTSAPEAPAPDQPGPDQPAGDESAAAEQPAS